MRHNQLLAALVIGTLLALPVSAAETPAGTKAKTSGKAKSGKAKAGTKPPEEPPAATKAPEAPPAAPTAATKAPEAPPAAPATTSPPGAPAAARTPAAPPAPPAVTKAPEASPATSACGGEQSSALAQGPVGVGYHEADFGTGRRACARSEIGIGARGGAIIDTPDFYGALAGDALLFGSVRLNPSLELFGTLEVLHYQYVQNASLKGTTMGVGQATLGGTYAVYRGGALAVAPSVRLMLPTSTTALALNVGAELGVAASLQLMGRLELHLYAGADYSAGISAAPAFPRFGGLALVGAQYSPLDWLGVVLDVDGHFGSRATIDYVAPSIAVRARVVAGLAAELGATLPLAGADRHDGLFALKLTYRL